jgi:hypothetical protein
MGNSRSAAFATINPRAKVRKWRRSDLPRCPHSGRDQVQSGLGIKRESTNWIFEYLSMSGLASDWQSFLVLGHKSPTSLLVKVQKKFGKIYAQE